MEKLWLDIETRSRVDIKKSNVYRYVEDPDFAILMCGWATEDDKMLGRVNMAIGEDEIRRIPGLYDDSVIKVAHNAAFERVCFSALAGLPVGTYLDPATYEDTQARAGEWGYPQKLEFLGPALGVSEKDSAGTRLINLFCKPNRKGEFTQPEEKPEEWQAFIEYCRQDVVTLIDVDDALPDFPSQAERDMYLLDQKINDDGLQVDTEMAQNALEAAAENQEEQRQEIIDLTGMANPGSVQQFGAWLESQGVKLPDMKAETVEAALKRDDISDKVRQVLELRQELALVASKKFTAALERVNSDGRLRGSLAFFGAHTGRWSGRGVQPQNLPSAQLPSAAHTEAAIMDLAMGSGADAHTLKALVRALFVGPYTVVDYSAIEARVISWLAGEQWALDAFAAGRDIYVETAGRMFDVDEKEALRRRKQGKVAVLALGYNGGVNSLRAMGAEGSDGELQGLVYQWRNANQNITHLWQTMDKAFRVGGQVGEHLRVEVDGTTRRLWLPSGRAISYHNVHEKWVIKWNKKVKEVSYTDPKKPSLRIPTYGGRLSENVTQAVARDLLVQALLDLDAAGYRVVSHVHDEIIIEGGEVDAVSSIMNKSPEWAAGLPVNSEGFSTYRYQKG